MPKFRVSVPTLWYQIVEVEAADKSEAVEIALGDGFEPQELEFEYARSLGVSIFAPSCSRRSGGLPEPDYTFLAREKK